jgi:hypothetical protein
MRLNPNATYDCLLLGSGLQRSFGGFSDAELHLLSYLSCLLSLYLRIPIADWGYSFVATEFGAPFSQHIDEAIKELLERGFFLRAQSRLNISGRAEQFVQGLSKLSLNQDRTRCLLAAFASTTAFSIGMVRNAMLKEPELSRAQKMSTNRFLLEEPATSQLYIQFDILRKALKPSNDLRVPAIVWLEALYLASETVEDQQ